MTAAPHPLATTLLGVPLRTPVMNAPGTLEHAHEIDALVAAGAGALCLRPVTAKPFVHPEFRALRNPGHDRLLPLVRQLTGMGAPPVVACVAGSTAEELAFLARVFGEAGAAVIQLHLTDPWVAVTLAPFRDLATLETVAAAVRAAAPVPVLCEIPNTVWRRYADIAAVLCRHGIGGVAVRGDFTGLEKFVLAAGRDALEIVAVADVESGWAARRLVAKGARAVQVDRPLRATGPAALARIVSDLRAAGR